MKLTYTNGDSGDLYIEPSTQNEDSEPLNNLHMMLMMMTQNEGIGLASPLPKICTIVTEPL